MHKLPSPTFPSAAGINPLRKQFFCDKHGPALRTAPDISWSINTLWWPQGADAHQLPASSNTLSFHLLVSRITLKNLPLASVSTWWQQSYKCCGWKASIEFPRRPQQKPSILFEARGQVISEKWKETLHPLLWWVPAWDGTEPLAVDSVWRQVLETLARSSHRWT